MFRITHYVCFVPLADIIGESVTRSHVSAEASGSRITNQTVETDITDITAAGVFSLGNRTVNRMGYGAMQLAGPSVFGPPKDLNAALGVLREAVARGVNHIDTSDYPHRAVTATTGAHNAVKSGHSSVQLECPKSARSGL
jgi:hypothetical protein